MSMKKWKYAQAHYDGASLDSIEMPGMVGNLPVGHFLREAGEKGWELCGVIPTPATQPGTGGTVELSLIFKMPME
jgi:hypothetical protein